MKIPTWVVCLGICIAIGCKGETEQRFRLSGKVDFDGKPIAYGDVLFTPDGAKQNSGPQGIANIRDGKFDTAAAGGKGIAGGPTIIRVTGFTGEGGKLLCEYEWSVDLPRSDSTKDLEVPKVGAAGKKINPGGDI